MFQQLHCCHRFASAPLWCQRSALVDGPLQDDPMKLLIIGNSQTSSGSTVEDEVFCNRPDSGGEVRSMCRGTEVKQKWLAKAFSTFLEIAISSSRRGEVLGGVTLPLTYYTHQC